MHNRRAIVARARPRSSSCRAKAFDVVAGDVEQRQLALLAPGRELAQVQRVRVAGETRVATQEPDQRSLLEPN